MTDIHEYQEDNEEYNRYIEKRRVVQDCCDALLALESVVG
jgi:hypothetical protein